jgi:predicted amidohydrolase
MNIVSLQLITTDDFENNLTVLVSLIEKTKQNSFIVAPELALNGYAYARLDEAVDISNKAIKILTKLSTNKTITITLTQKSNVKHKYLNTLFCFHNGKIIHTQSKAKLFVLNDERKYFTSGMQNDIKIIDLNGIRVGFLICFELRFIQLWQKLQGADIIVIPAMWGKLRKDNFETLTKALAVMNQCFVIASDSANDDMAKSSGIISPFGDTLRDDDKTVITKQIELKEIQKMRRYMQVGIK